MTLLPSARSGPSPQAANPALIWPGRSPSLRGRTILALRRLLSSSTRTSAPAPLRHVVPRGLRVPARCTPEAGRARCGTPFLVGAASAWIGSIVELRPSACGPSAASRTFFTLACGLPPCGRPWHGGHCWCPPLGRTLERVRNRQHGAHPGLSGGPQRHASPASSRRCTGVGTVMPRTAARPGGSESTRCSSCPTPARGANRHPAKRTPARSACCRCTARARPPSRPASIVGCCASTARAERAAQ